MNTRLIVTLVLGVLGVVLRLEFALQRDLARPPAQAPEG